jgi:hypothetical protein
MHREDGGELRRGGRGLDPVVDGMRRAAGRLPARRADQAAVLLR